MCSGCACVACFKERTLEVVLLFWSCLAGGFAAGVLFGDGEDVMIGSADRRLA